MLSLQQAFYQLKEELQSLYDSQESAAITHQFLEHITGLTKLDRLTNKDKPLTAQQKQQYLSGKSRLLTGEPLQHITGIQWFYGNSFNVSKDVLIPRPETEELVEWIIQDWKSKDTPAILDIGTGSGCIPITLKLKLPSASVTSIDISSNALAIASRNAASLSAPVNLLQLDFLEKELWLQFEKYDVIVSNPPYIPITDMELVDKNVRDYEPAAALFVPTEDALLFYRHIAEFGRTHLNASGAIYCELNAENAERTQDIFLMSGYKNVDIGKDMHGKDRMLKATF